MYSTTDIVQAATLRTLGYELDHIDKLGNKGTFFFGGVDMDVIQRYDLGQLQVEPVAFNNAIKALTTAARR